MLLSEFFRLLFTYPKYALSHVKVSSHSMYAKYESSFETDLNYAALYIITVILYYS